MTEDPRITAARERFERELDRRMLTSMFFGDEAGLEAVMETASPDRRKAITDALGLDEK